MSKVTVILLFICLFSCDYTSFKKIYNEAYLNQLLKISKGTILKELHDKEYNTFQDIKYANNNFGVFLRITKNGKERGCFGFLKNVKSIEEAVKKASINASFFDKRYPVLNQDELDKISLEVTIIGRIEKIKNYDDFKIGIHSLFIDNKINKGFLQAQIALEEKYSKEEFLKALCKKAGMQPEEYKKNNIKLYRAVTVSLKKKFNNIEM